MQGKNFTFTRDKQERLLLNSDTDSFYISIAPLMDVWDSRNTSASEEKRIEVLLKIVNTKIQPVIDKVVDNINDRLNLYDKTRLIAENEIVATRFVSAASKRYFALQVAKDGTILAKPKIKATGISLIGKATPPEVKAILEPLTKLILTEDNDTLLTYIKENKDRFLALDPSQVSKTQSVNSLDYHFCKADNTACDFKMAVKGTKRDEEKNKNLTAPMNSKAAMVHNAIVDELELQNIYDYVHEGDNIKMCYLKVPNPITYSLDVVGYKDPKFLEDSGLTKYVDYEIQWTKEFIAKILPITNSLKWTANIEDMSNIDEDEW